MKQLLCALLLAVCGLASAAKPTSPPAPARLTITIFAPPRFFST